jgi:hypothetical protein
MIVDKSKVLLLLSIIFIGSCKSPTEQLQDVVGSTIESVAEAQTGQSIDLPDGDNYEKNQAIGTLSVNGKEYMNSSMKYIGNVAGQRDENGKLVSIQLANETGSTLMIVISKYPEKISLPFTCKLYKEGEIPSDKTSAKIVFMALTENSMESYLSFGGEVKITKMNEEEVEFSIDGKTGVPSNLDNPSKWIDMKGKFVIKSPTIMTIGMQKEDILQ